jgi:hypothetical protein
LRWDRHILRMVICEVTPSQTTDINITPINHQHHHLRPYQSHQSLRHQTPLLAGLLH